MSSSLNKEFIIIIMKDISAPVSHSVRKSNKALAAWQNEIKVLLNFVTKFFDNHVTMGAPLSLLLSRKRQSTFKGCCVLLFFFFF